MGDRCASGTTTTVGMCEAPGTPRKSRRSASRRKGMRGVPRSTLCFRRQVVLWLCRAGVIRRLSGFPAAVRAVSTCE